MNKLFIIFYLIIGIVLISGCIESEKNNSKPSSVLPLSNTSPSGDYSCAELMRVIDRAFPRMTNLSLYPGDLPSDMPIKVPIPEDAVIIGSAVYSYEPYHQIEVFLDMPGVQTNIFEYYQKNLENFGWNESEFSFINMPGTLYYCRYEGKGPSLMITPHTLNEETLAHVRLILDTNPRTFICNTPSQGFNQAGDIIPILLPPEGATERDLRISGGLEEQYISEVNLDTELSTLELENHYQNQLREAGWELNENVGGSPSIALSSWAFTDGFGDHWSGVLSVHEVEGSELSLVFFAVQLVQ